MHYLTYLKIIINKFKNIFVLICIYIENNKEKIYFFIIFFQDN